MIEFKMHITPEDTLHAMNDNIANDRLYIKAMGNKQINEVSDYVVTKDAIVHYHEHDHGFELFTVDKGSVEATICGKRCVMREGDFVLVPPFTPHGFVYKEEGTIWRELFTEMDMYDYMMDYDRIMQNCPENFQNEEFMREYHLVNGKTDLPEPDAAEWCDAKDVPFVRPAGTQVKQYKFPGIVCNLKYGRWDIHGIKEIWEYVLEKGMRFSWDKYHHNWDLFIVKKGAVRVEVANCEPFVAKERDIINIPPYHLHKLTVLEEGTVLHDYNCQAKVMRLIEEFQLLEERRPEALSTHEGVAEVLKRHGCPVTDFKKVEI